MDFRARIDLSEKSFIELFSTALPINPNHPGIVRYFDDEIKDMYDHNFACSKTELSQEGFSYLLSFKEKRRENFMKISLDQPSSFLKENGFEEERLLTLAKEDFESFSIKSPRFATYRRYRENPAILEDVIRIEKKYYGKEYGEDFCQRRWERYAKKIEEGDNGLDIWVAYEGEKSIAYCYTYFAFETVCLDGLLVIEEYRNRYVASNLIKDIAQHYNCPIFLHADEDETPKDLYYRLGFKKHRISYDYQKIDK